MNINESINLPEEKKEKKNIAPYRRYTYYNMNCK